MRSGYRRSRRVLFIVDLIRNGVNNDLPGYSGLPVVGLYEPANQGSIELPVSSNSVPLLACPAYVFSAIARELYARAGGPAGNSPARQGGVLLLFKRLLAMMFFLVKPEIASGFTSGTISGTSGS